MIYSVHGLDVWEADGDGFEINDVLPSQGTIEVSLDSNRDAEEIIQALIDADYLHPVKLGIPDFYEIREYDSNDSSINVVNGATGKPLLQLVKKQ